MKLSVVTVSMNRTSQLIQSAARLGSLHFHFEHLIIDYGSDPSIQSCDLPDDPRIKVLKCSNPNGRWWLTHSYNLAFSHAQGEYILKLDADILLSNIFFAELFHRLEHRPDMLCNRLTLQDWRLPNNFFITNGLFAVKTSALREVNGFNPYIQGWGWDEIDLYSRIFMSGFSILRLPSAGVSEIRHSDSIRANACTTSENYCSMLLPKPTSSSRMVSLNAKNEAIALKMYSHQLGWTSLQDYHSEWLKTGSLPVLTRINIFEQNELTQLHQQLVRYLLRLNYLQFFVLKLLALLGLGPLCPHTAKGVLEANGVSLKLVAD